MNLASPVGIFSTHPPLSAMEYANDERLMHNDDDDAGSDESSEVEDKLSSIHAMRGGASSLRRSDSWNSFLTRSQRTLLLGKDKPPPKEETIKRKVQFPDDSAALEQVYEIELVPDNIKPHVYMNDHDFEEHDKEVSLTRFRWENHKSGKIKFDEAKHSIRGLEKMINPNEQEELSKWNHVKRVLTAIHEQKISGKGEIDWEKIRRTSSQSSARCLETAVIMGRKDEEAHHRAWNDKIVDDSPFILDNKNKSKKKGRGLFFWKKE